jgi:hypothetical protein
MQIVLFTDSDNMIHLQIAEVLIMKTVTLLSLSYVRSLIVILNHLYSNFEYSYTDEMVSFIVQSSNLEWFRSLFIIVIHVLNCLQCQQKLTRYNHHIVVMSSNSVSSMTKEPKQSLNDESDER